MRQLAIPLGLLLSVGLDVDAGTLASYQSPVEQVPVLELYTSHGCSSCPPADDWLRRFTDQPGLWNEVIPLAFHVDYWDDLGWPDRFASSVFSDRQRSYARSGRLSSVYTPGFVIAGQEWRGWFSKRAPDLQVGPAVGSLYVELSDAPQASIRFAAVETWEPGRLTAHLAVVGFGLTTPVGGGENRGRDLEEDFVVLGYRSSRQSGPKPEWEMAFPEVVRATTKRRALVVWLSVDSDPAPLQAVAGWLP